ncbi:MAG TPA: phage tail protein [Fimbriimonadaceae bacterium]|nr:phage tail protein [Fimbriimonadaceae bacterium]
MAIAGPAGQKQRLPKPRLEGIEAELTPDYAFRELRPKPRGVSPERLGMLWHEVPRPRGATLKLSADDGRSHKLHICVESSDGRWRPQWIKWSFPTRQARELQGGDSLTAQDELHDEDRRLNLMLTANETRYINLEFVASLDGETGTGDFPFEVVIQDITADANGGAGELRVNGILCLTHPDAKLLDQLPSLYREALHDLREDVGGYQDPPFFERYLRGFEDTFEPLQATLEQLDTLFGPYSTPSDFLLWLGTWVVMPLDENWPEMRRRKLIAEAVELYRWRGTKRGLSRYLEIYCGVKPEINDQPVEGMRLGPDAKLGTKATVLGDVPPHTFVVTIALPDNAKINEQTIHDIIRYEKPAHTAYALRVVRRGHAD